MSNWPKLATFAATFIMVLGASGFAVGEEGERKKPWQTVDLGGNSGNIATEKSTGTINGGTLSSTWEGIEGNPSYDILTQQIDNNEELLMDLDGRIGLLEGGGAAEDNWVLQPPTQDSTAAVSAGSKQATFWESPIENQVSGFDQTRSVSESKSFPMQVYEYNTTTGERRIVDAYTETKDRQYLETRYVSVQSSNWEDETITTMVTYYGYSYPMITPAYFNCSGWVPARSTVSAGQYYFGSKNCNINQTRTTDYRTSTGTYSMETLKTTTESQVGTWESGTTFLVGTKPIAVECYTGWDSPNHYISAIPSMGIGSFSWKSSTGVLLVQATPYASRRATREYPWQYSGYDYWGENYTGWSDGSSGNDSTGTLCRMPSASNSERINGTGGSPN